MSISWENQFVYLFPPFSMIWPVLNKMPLELIKTLVIAPMWPTQSWFNKLLELAVEQPMIIESKYLQLPGTNQKYPLYPKLRQFRKKQSMSSMQREEMGRKTNINTYSEDGKDFVVKRTTIQHRLIQI